MTTLKNLMARLPKGCDGALVSSETCRLYFTGFRSSAGVLALTREDAVFYTDFRYIEAAKAQISVCRVERIDKITEQIGDFFAAQHAKTIAIESRGMTVSALEEYRRRLPGLTFLQDDRFSECIEDLRMIKSEAELEHIQTAQQIAESAYLGMLERLAVGRSEREIALELEMAMRKAGAEGVSFDLIIASGEGSAVPHWKPGDRTLRKGDFVTLDIGCKWDGYCSDMTRTVAIGQVSDEMRHVYETVQAAQTAAFAAIRPGAICKEVDRAAREVIEKAGYGAYFGHGLGHSLGLEVHEPPAFNPRCDAPLKPGMVLSVEPGIYLEGRFGVRIEDLIAVREDGFLNLNRSDKALLIL